jgi:hypothetical protein
MIRMKTWSLHFGPRMMSIATHEANRHRAGKDRTHRELKPDEAKLGLLDHMGVRGARSSGRSAWRAA